MAGYNPLFKPGQAVTLRASAAITGGQLLDVTGNRTVGPAAAGSTAWTGVAGFDAAVGGDVTIFSGGVQRLKASGAVAAGSLVIAGAAGTVAVVVAPATPAVGQQVGTALSTAADGALVEVQMAR